MEKFLDFIQNNSWIFAITYAKTAPHWYVRKTPDNADDFEEVARFIRTNGVERKFYRKTFIYFDHEDYTYWTMGYPISETTIINRAKL